MFETRSSYLSFSVFNLLMSYSTIMTLLICSRGYSCVGWKVQDLGKIFTSFLWLKSFWESVQLCIEHKTEADVQTWQLCKRQYIWLSVCCVCFLQVFLQEQPVVNLTGTWELQGFGVCALCWIISFITLQFRSQPYTKLHSKASLWNKSS